MILDSGNRSEFASGAVRDIQAGKGRCDLLPLDIVCKLYMCLDSLPETKCIVFDLIYRFIHTGDVHWLYETLECLGVYNDFETMLLEVSVHFEEGARKYGDRNWEKGIPVQRYIDSALRHYLKYLRGDTDENHNRAVYWNIICAIWTAEHIPELNEYKQEEWEK